MAFEHLRQSAGESFRKAKVLQASKPEAAMAATSSGHEALATYYLANADSRFTKELHALLLNELKRYETYGATVRTFPQHTYLVLALAIGDVNLAKTLAALPVERKYWSAFDADVTYRICGLLGIRQDARPQRTSSTTTERKLTAALEDIRSGKDFDSTAVEDFWRKLRKKRYELTIFEHQNLFVPALRTLKHEVQRRVGE